MGDYIEQGALGLAFFLSVANIWLTKHALAVIEHNTEVLTEMKGTIRENTKAIRAILRR